ncbi:MULTISPECIES: DUF6355 family natural product biosynthesis protein [Streptomyces]|uniref:Uncharacterized protein n=1 Tax=Streptomyces siderophoricus TaxID=2802281 RepID=A0ABS1MLQ0_9ACTN|nr:DUF6355 family natural product biosynthesis protein [Streptomyces sp. 9-7]MBL1087884.1 hypothetical protein [Streptomyces sp. 9-7]
MRGFAALMLDAAAFCGTVAAAPGQASALAKEPCGFRKTGSDAYYRHGASNGSNVVIKVEVAWAPDHERCVRPDRTWLGSASRIQGAHYMGRTC